MSAPDVGQFVAEIRMFAGNFAPSGWAFCDGQLMSIAQNTALFSLLGTNYGGNGQTTFGLPDLRGQAALAAGEGAGLTPRAVGEFIGEPAVTLLVTEMPIHTHALRAVATPGTQTSASGGVFAVTGAVRGGGPPVYASTPGTAPLMNDQALGVVGGNLPHNNMPPYLVVNFIIALLGIFPARQ
jgi:microcystin-dependent protein